MNIKAEPLTRDSIWAPTEDLNIVDTLRKCRGKLSEIRKRPKSTLPPPYKVKKEGPKANQSHMQARLRALAIQRGEYKVQP